MHEAPAFIFVDIETTGFDPAPNLGKDLILEVGLAAYDQTLTRELAYTSVVISGQAVDHRYAELFNEASEGGDRWALDTHGENKLWLDVIGGEGMGGLYPHEAEETLALWLVEHGGGKKLPMTGNTVGFDRKFLAAQMPRVAAQFTHRSVDISAIKELLHGIGRSDIVEEATRATEALDIPKSHRVRDCLSASAAELRTYASVFTALPTLHVVDRLDDVDVPAYLADGGAL